MNHKRGKTFYDWCWSSFPEARLITASPRVAAAAIDGQSFLRWHAQEASSPRALLDKLRELVLWHAPHVDMDASLHMDIINTSYEASQEDVASGDVEFHLYKKDWLLDQADTVGSCLIDDPVRLDQWPMGDPDLRMIHFDWTAFAWQWRVLVTREARQHYIHYEVYNKLDESVMDLIKKHRGTGPPARVREIQLALEMNRQSHDQHTKFQPRWRGLLSAIRTLFESKCKTFYLRTCAADGLWMALVAALHALEQGVQPDQWICLWCDQQGMDIVQLASSIVHRFKEAKVGLAVCLLFWVDTSISDARVLENVLTRLEQGQIRASKGGDFTLSLSCLVHGRGYALDNSSSHVLNTCNALCRAVWQRQHGETHAGYKPDSIVYPRIFWEAWNIRGCPDFTQDIVECIHWMNLANNALVNDSLVPPPHRTEKNKVKADPLYYGLVSHVGGV